MSEFLDNAGGSGYSAAILWTLAALVLLLVALIVVKMVRSMRFGTFVSGGRNRKTRLAVMDATAVDSHRRLVLVRRDDVEHLILIGGPTDVVVERDIRLAGPRRAAPGNEPAMAQPPARAPAPPVQPRAVQPQPPVAAPHRSAPAPVQPPATRPAESAPPVPAPVSRMNAPMPPRPVQSVDEALDDSLASELALSLGEPAPASPPPPSPTLDDEMSRLLGELSNGKR